MGILRNLVKPTRLEFLGLMVVALATVPVIADPAPIPATADPVPPKPDPGFWDSIVDPEQRRQMQEGENSGNGGSPPGGSGLGSPNAFGGFGTMNGFGAMNMMPGPGGYGMTRFNLINAGLTFYPSQTVTNQNAHLGMERASINAAVPVWSNGTDIVSVTASVRSTIYQTDAILPDTGRKFPDQIYNINMGVNYSHRFDNGWMAGFMAGFGSSSDQPFGSIHEVNANLMGFLRVPSGDRNAWLFSLMYAPQGELSFPIPGIAYQWRPTDNFMMNIGLPFTIMWLPWEDILVNLSYVPVRTVHGRVTWRAAEELAFFAGFDWSSEAAYLYDRTDNQERFIYYEKRLSTGLQFRLSPKTMLECSTGYAFDRFYFTGKSFADRNHDRVDVGSGAFIAANFRWRF